MALQMNVTHLGKTFTDAYIYIDKIVETKPNIIWYVSAYTDNAKTIKIKELVNGKDNFTIESKYDAVNDRATGYDYLKILDMFSSAVDV